MMEEGDIRFLARVNSLTAEMHSVVARIEACKAANRVRRAGDYADAYGEGVFGELADQLERIQRDLAAA